MIQDAIKNPEIVTPYQDLVDQPMPDPARDIDLDQYRLVPWPGRILVRRFPADTLTKGGLHLPSDAQEAKSWGEVVALPAQGGPPGIEIGDYVVFLQDAGDPVEAFGPGLVMLDYTEESLSDIMGVLMKKEKDPGSP